MTKAVIVILGLPTAMALFLTMAVSILNYIKSLF